MIYLDDVLEATGGQLYQSASVTRFDDFCFDSRNVAPGQLFIAVKTETGDGHDYIAAALAGGATGVLCERPEALNGHTATCVVVPDTRQALLDWAEHVLRRYGPTVVGVTGSSGKTTTKDAIASVLSTILPAYASLGSFNGRYGLPIALGRLTPDIQVAVLELAADGLGEIGALTALCHPQIGVITSINHAHLAFFGSLETTAREKGDLLAGLPADGLAVLNADDPLVMGQARRTRARVLTVGRTGAADWQATDVQLRPDGVHCMVRMRSADGAVERFPLRWQLLGAHQLFPALAALAVGREFGVLLDRAVEALSTLKPLPGRLHPHPGRHGSTLLDDTFNASPAAVLAALETLAGSFPDAPRLAILGDMSELGAYEAEAHRTVGRRAAEVVDALICKGERAYLIARAARDHGLPPGRIFHTYSDDEVVAWADRWLREHSGGVVLLKGAALARLERVVEQLLDEARAARARARLVRQTAAWRQVRLRRPDRPTWLEVDLEAVANNVRALREIIGSDTELLAVLKADGYGHGAVAVGRTTLNNGARMLGVACLAEAVHLRRNGITAPILVLGYTPAWQARDTLLHDVTATVFDVDSARAFSRAALDLERKARLHVKVDTGMGRLGLLPDEAVAFVNAIAALPGLELEGIFTHFSLAEADDKSYTYWQLDRFRPVLAELEERGHRFRFIHAANSAALLTVPESRFNLVRAGIALYGLGAVPASFRRALSWKSQIAQVKTLPPGSFVSYGNTYRTTGEERIAVVPVGYADGFRRAPAHWGYVLVRGQRAPLVGRVCMDQTMLNVTHIPDVRQGDEVVLIGQQGDEEITVDNVAERLGTINYEVVAEILARVPRMV